MEELDCYRKINAPKARQKVSQVARIRSAGVAATTRWCFLYIPFIKERALSIKVLKILAYRAHVQNYSVFARWHPILIVRVSLVPNVTAGGELYPAFTGLQRASVCFQGRGKARRPGPAAARGLYPAPLQLQRTQTAQACHWSAGDIWEAASASSTANYILLL